MNIGDGRIYKSPSFDDVENNGSPVGVMFVADDCRTGEFELAVSRDEGKSAFTIGFEFNPETCFRQYEVDMANFR